MMPKAPGALLTEIRPLSPQAHALAQRKARVEGPRWARDGTLITGAADPFERGAAEARIHPALAMYRARTVEPVFGQLKTCQKLTMMSRRGLAACENEWLLACAAHNLRKLHRYRLEG